MICVRDEEIKSSIHLVHTSSKQASYRRKKSHSTRITGFIINSWVLTSLFNTIRPSYFALYPMFDSFHLSQSRSSSESTSSLTMRSGELSVVFITAFLMPKECATWKNQSSDDGKREETESRNKILGEYGKDSRLFLDSHLEDSPQGWQGIQKKS